MSIPWWIGCLAASRVIEFLGVMEQGVAFVFIYSLSTFGFFFNLLPSKMVPYLVRTFIILFIASGLLAILYNVKFCIVYQILTLYPYLPDFWGKMKE